jgi:hypothetical protein
MYNSGQYCNQTDTSPMGRGRSNSVCDIRNKPKSVMQSDCGNTRQEMKEQREIPNESIQQDTQHCVQNLHLITVQWEYQREAFHHGAINKTMVDITQPEWYCSGAKKLNNMLAMICFNF